MQDQDRKGKRIISGPVNEELQTDIPRLPGSNSQKPPVAAEGLTKLPVVIDSFGAINILPTVPRVDKFGAVQEWDENQSSSFGSTFSRRMQNAEESTGSFNIAADHRKIIEEAQGRYHVVESGSHSVNESGWGKKHIDHSTSAATSNACSSRVYDGPHSSSTAFTYTFDERTSNDNDADDIRELGGPPVKRFRDSPRYVSLSDVCTSS